ncbi:MAG: Beta-galactosidase [Haliscomenobacter sp.]|jgi:hypothetical protein|nr:Beta-galactosidase [Haliscomenobacter sp.]
MPQTKEARETNPFQLKTAIALSLILFSVHFTLAQPQAVSLAGRWRIALDGNFRDWPFKTGVTEKWYAKELPSNTSIFRLNQIYFKNAEFETSDWITLPGSTDEAGIGVVLNPSPAYTPGLERLHTYDGAFWVQRTVTIPESWSGKTVYLFLERTLGGSAVFWDDQKVGEDYGVAIPHRIRIDSAVQPGEHRLTLLINKDDIRYAHYGHHAYSGNGASWNGIVGRIELQAKDPSAHIEQVQVYPKIQTGSLEVRVLLNPQSHWRGRTLKLYIRRPGETAFTLVKNQECGSDTIQTRCEVPEPVLLWSEFTPAVYELLCLLDHQGKTTDSVRTTFGMREIGTKEGYITINHQKVLLRGTLDNGSSPLTGYPHMQLDKWLEIWNICKSYGLNHIRFHTWCPPEAAFAAADQAGLYLQVELAGVPYAEIDRILDTYGNHPSFCLLSLGNEVMGSTEWNQQVVAKAKIKDNRHLYACTSHPVGPDRNDDFFVSAWGIEKTAEWPFAKRIVGITWGGGDVVHASRFNLWPPETKSSFSSEIKGLPVPVLAHEMGQWAMFPDLDEIPKYHPGVLRNTNYERIKDQIEKRGLLPLHKAFAKASGMFSAILYKEEIESVLRTPGYGGFQLLDLHDYQGQHISIVGILTDSWESKGLVTPRQHRQYCHSVTPLAKMDKRVWTNTELFEAGVDISNFTFADIPGVKPLWTLQDTNQRIVAKGALQPLTLKKGALTSFVAIQAPLTSVREASKLTLRVALPELNVENTWEIWVYPETLPDPPGEVQVLGAKDLETVEALLRQGKTVLLQLDSSHLKGYRERCFTPIFWNSILKWPQRAHTLGIWCQPAHPVFSRFPTDYHSNWQWWDIAMNAYAMNMNELPKELTPLIQVIDSYIINEKLAYLWECQTGGGNLVVSSINLTDDLENRPASRQLKHSILEYMQSREFNPAIRLDFQQIKALIE